MKTNEKKKREPWYSMRDTGNPKYPKYHLTHWCKSKRFTIMVLAWDVNENRANGWFQMGEYDTIKEARIVASNI